jgi:hypothetical protein
MFMLRFGVFYKNRGSMQNTGILPAGSGALIFRVMFKWTIALVIIETRDGSLNKMSTAAAAF